MIENIFEFNNSTAEDVMIHRTDMVFLQVEDTRSEILKTIEESGLSRFPVYAEDPDDIIGILSTRDYLLNTQRSEPKALRELLRDPYLSPRRSAPTCCSGICRAARYIWPSWWTNTAARQVW